MKRYQIPILEPKAQVERRCRHCGRTGGQVHQHRIQHPVDTRLERVEKIRMRCAFCQKTWTCQPEGMKESYSRSQRVRALNVLLYALGLSYRAVAAIVTALGAPESPASVYEDVTQSGTQAQQLHDRDIARPVQMVGMDGTGQLLAEPGDSHSEGVMFAVDFGSGRLLCFELLDERDAEALQGFVDKLRKRFSVTEWVGDDHRNHRTCFEKDAKDRYWICTAHFKRAKKRRLRKLRKIAESKDSPVKKPEPFLQSVEKLERLLDEPPEDGEAQAYALYRSWYQARAPGEGETATPEWLLKQVALEISEKWRWAWSTTNNVTERAIGRLLKIRSKTMRGFKKRENIVRFVHLCDWMTAGSARLDLAEVL